MPDRADRDEEHLEDRRPDEGLGDHAGAGDRKLLDDEGGYGGGRKRAEQAPDHEFGERGWGGGRAQSEDRHPPENSAPDRHMPEGVRDTGPDDARWQERYTRENADKYGQGGGQPIRQRGAGQSMGGFEHREQSLGSTKDLSAHGTYGSRETERWPGENGGKFSGTGPENFKVPDERIREDVRQRLTDHPTVNASGIEVVVQEGEVTLSGTVEDPGMKRLAEDVVREIPGVRDVHNQIRAVPRG